MSNLETNLLGNNQPQQQAAPETPLTGNNTDLNNNDAETDPIKSVQKLTGKLGQKIREIGQNIETQDIKYILNSIISAIPMNKLNDADKNDVIKKINSQGINEVGIDSPIDSTARFRASGGHTLTEDEKIKLLNMIKKK